MLLDTAPTLKKVGTSRLGRLADELADIIASGGPKPEDYASLNRGIRQVGDDIRAGILEVDAVRRLIRDFTVKHFAGTLQAAAREKARGYSGDYEMIDAIYTLKIAEAPKLRRWDLYFHSQAAPCAVRNRKAHFLNLLSSLREPSDGSRLRVLNIGSGPARDIREWFLSAPATRIFFDCVEMDSQAIRYASDLCRPFLQHVEFHHENALRYVPSGGYDLVWSAGLLDYLNDRLFVRLLRALLLVVRPGGSLVVGNFSDFNPSRDYMEIFGDWHLVHRSLEQLLMLAERAGVRQEDVSICWEPEGVNLFLQVRVH